MGKVIDLGGEGAGGGGVSLPSGDAIPRVDNYASLPSAIAHTDEIYYVRNTTGVWPVNWRKSGLYISDGITWTNKSTFLDRFKDSSMSFFDDADNTKEVRFELSGITTGTKRVVTFQDKDGVIAYLSDIPVGGDIGQVIEFGNLGIMSSTTGAMSKTGTKNETVSPTGMPSTSAGNPGMNNGNNDGWMIQADKDFTKIGVKIAGAAVAGGVPALDSASLRLDIYQTNYSNRTLLRTERVLMSPVGVGIFNNSSGNAFQYQELTFSNPLALTGGQLIGIEFVNETGLNQINSLRRIEGFML